MENKLLVTQALDERRLLKKKIHDKIEKASFVDIIRRNEEQVSEKRIPRQDFHKEAESAYQQINDLITRYTRLDAAIIQSNANTWIDTSYGRLSVAAAISLRDRLAEDHDFGYENKDFYVHLYDKMKKEYTQRVEKIETKNKALAQTAENMRLSILGKDTKTREEKPLEVVEAYVKENTSELADPLDIRRKMEELKERRDTLLTELDTQIKVSNATVFITV
ncbi:MAG TPA: hypothetical protein IAA21_05040 [Candidatus Blautia faecigallinarum]|uniref:Uncharacterized protein n=1 Tax=Candidatus Blautia faecigallinarum TaxID=2838488 RepID=A0A9D2DSG9_9FIRM|nr:hypothetical protein [Candidatus Blautia faecigallinarum]